MATKNQRRIGRTASPDRNLTVTDLMALPPDALLTLPEVVLYLATTERNVRRLVYGGHISSIKMGGLLRFRKRALDEYLDSRTREAEAR
jgi:excisionase family DNA binding protein